MPTFKHVLVATDFTESASRALELAVSIAHDSGAELTIVNACDLPTYSEFAIPDSITVAAENRARSQVGELAASVRDRCPGAKGVVRVGAAWEQILALAADTKADLIVVGTHGRRGLAHAMMGSVAERVVRLSPVPVLTVRSR